MQQESNSRIRDPGGEAGPYLGVCCWIFEDNDVFSCSKMYRWIRGWALTTLLWKRMAISESEHTVKTCNGLTHAYNLEKRVASRMAQVFWLVVIEETISLPAY